MAGGRPRESEMARADAAVNRACVAPLVRSESVQNSISSDVLTFTTFRTLRAFKAAASRAAPPTAVATPIHRAAPRPLPLAGTLATSGICRSRGAGGSRTWPRHAASAPSPASGRARLESSSEIACRVDSL